MRRPIVIGFKYDIKLSHSDFGFQTFIGAQNMLGFQSTSSFILAYVGWVSIATGIASYPWISKAIGFHPYLLARAIFVPRG